jgi:hypothetical protein
MTQRAFDASSALPPGVGGERVRVANPPSIHLSPHLRSSPARLASHRRPRSFSAELTPQQASTGLS